MSNGAGDIVRVLMIEDNPADVHLVRHILQQAAPRAFEVTHAESLRSGMECLQAGIFHLVLLDLGLPDTSGLASVGEMVRRRPDLPVVVLTGLDDTDTALQAVRLGVQDYCVKTELEGKLLVRTLRYAVERHRLLRVLDETRQEQMRLEEQFLSHVSHELRSPLTSVHQFASILLDGLGGRLSRRQRQYLAVILRNAIQLRSMIEELLDVTRAGSGKLRVERGAVKLPELIRDCISDVRPAATAKSLRLRCQVSPLPRVDADPRRVSQILNNLLENAVKFTPRGGSILLRAKRAGDGDLVCVQVSDTGCGIDPQTLPRIFERLYQGAEATESARKGLGLGLYICRELLARQGGRIWAESAVGKGTTVSFTLPVFSLQTFLEPVLAALRRPTALQLVTINLTPAARISSESWNHARRQARWIIQRCIMPDRDVLLPSIGDGERRDAVFVFACADDNGLKVMMDRIRDQLLRSAEISAGILFQLKAAEFRPSASHRIKPPQARHKALAEQLLRTILARMQRRYVHAKTKNSDRRRRPRHTPCLASPSQGQ